MPTVATRVRRGNVSNEPMKTVISAMKPERPGSPRLAKIAKAASAK